ncbi:MAG: PAAR domain-containing protein [Kofleriaceae bacterium]|nr:PAAR domain-containing protein [Kofleriaceae bacterium]
MPPQGRIGDKAQVPVDAHGCPGCPHSCTGPGVQGSPDVMTNSKPSLRQGDPGIHAACCGPNTWTAAKGSGTVFINNKPAHRQGDQTTHCGGSGMLTEGSNNVMVGG